MQTIIAGHLPVESAFGQIDHEHQPEEQQTRRRKAVNSFLATILLMLSMDYACPLASKRSIHGIHSHVEDYVFAY